MSASLDSTGMATLSAVVKHGTFDAAARALHVTPSAVSQRIRALEERVGRVLVRRSKPVAPTDAGRVLLRLAGQVEVLEAEALAQLTDEVALDGGLRFTHLPVAVTADTLATWVIDAMVLVQSRHAVTFDLRREDQSISGDLLRDGTVVGAITSTPRPVPGCEVLPLGVMRYLPVASPGYLERYLPDRLDVESIGRAPVISFDRNDDLQDEMLAQVADGQLAPPTTYIPSSRDFDGAVRAGLGWGVVPESALGDDLASGALVELWPGRHVDVPLYWQYWSFGSVLMADLAQAIEVSARRWLRPAHG